MSSVDQAVVRGGVLGLEVAMVRRVAVISVTLPRSVGGHSRCRRRVRSLAAPQIGACAPPTARDGQVRACAFPRCRRDAVGVCTLCSEATCADHLTKHWNVRLFAGKGDVS
jgi:hypothetical protein